MSPPGSIETQEASITISFAFQLAFVPRGALERTALDDVLSLCKSVRYPSDRHSAEGWYHVGWPNDPRHEIDGKLVTISSAVTMVQLLNQCPIIMLRVKVPWSSSSPAVPMKAIWDTLDIPALEELVIEGPAAALSALPEILARAPGLSKLQVGCSDFWSPGSHESMDDFEQRANVTLKGAGIDPLLLALRDKPLADVMVYFHSPLSRDACRKLADLVRSCRSQRLTLSLARSAERTPPQLVDCIVDAVSALGPESKYLHLHLPMYGARIANALNKTTLEDVSLSFVSGEYSADEESEVGDDEQVVTSRVEPETPTVLVGEQQHAALYSNLNLPSLRALNVYCSEYTPPDMVPALVDFLNRASLRHFHTQLNPNDVGTVIDGVKDNVRLTNLEVGGYLPPMHRIELPPVCARNRELRQRLHDTAPRALPLARALLLPASISEGHTSSLTLLDLPPEIRKQIVRHATDPGALSRRQWAALEDYAADRQTLAPRPNSLGSSSISPKLAWLRSLGLEFWERDPGDLLPSVDDYASGAERELI